MTKEPLIYRFGGVELFPCKELDKYFCTPPGQSELFMGQIPKFSCVNCDNSCSFRKGNLNTLLRQTLEIYNSRSPYNSMFLQSLGQYRENIIKSLKKLN